MKNPKNLTAQDVECPFKCGPVVLCADGSLLCNCGHFGGANEEPVEDFGYEASPEDYEPNPYDGTYSEE